MSHERRVFVSLSSHTAGTEVELEEEDAHHLRTVLRLAPGDPVTVVDRQTSIAFDSFVSVAETPFIVTLGRPRSNPLPHHTIRGLLMALCKNRVNDIITEKATELGVEYIVFWQAERSVVRYYASEDRQKRAERLRKIAEEAARQSGRSSLPEILVVQSLDEALVLAKKAASDDERFFFGSLGEDAVPLTKRDPLVGRASVLIGPEGDITGAEDQKLRAFGFEPFTLGATRLRSETAACAAITAVDIFGSLSR